MRTTDEREIEAGRDEPSEGYILLRCRLSVRLHGQPAGGGNGAAHGRGYRLETCPTRLEPQCVILLTCALPRRDIRPDKGASGEGRLCHGDHVSCKAQDPGRRSEKNSKQFAIFVCCLCFVLRSAKAAGSEGSSLQRPHPLPSEDGVCNEDIGWSEGPFHQSLPVPRPLPSELCVCV